MIEGLQVQNNLYGSYDQGGRGTADFRTTKEYIREACIYSSQAYYALLVESDARDAVHLGLEDAAPDGNVRLFINNEWNYTNPGLGYYMKPSIIVGDGCSNKVRMSLGTAQVP